MIYKLILVLGHFEKVRGLLNFFEGFAADRVHVIIQSSIVLGNKGFLSYIVPTLVIIQIDITGVIAPFPQFLSCPFVAIAGGTNIFIVAYQSALIQILKASHKLLRAVQLMKKMKCKNREGKNIVLFERTKTMTKYANRKKRK